MRGCICSPCQIKRDYMRDYMRKRNQSTRPIRLARRAPLSPVALHDQRVGIEQAIARGESTSQIMQSQHVDYETVQKVRARLDAAVA